MDGNVAFDVVIGLIFIYLLYSLYATILMEIISSVFGLRARNLCYTLKRMMMDERKYANALDRIGSRILTTVTRVSGNSVNLGDASLYKDFFNQPSIKYLSSGGAGNRPSYLSAENFSKGIIDAVKIDNPDASILACFEEGLMRYPIDSETRIQLQSLLDDANYDFVKFKILLENWYNETMERSTGWFKQTTQAVLLIIGFVLTVSFNVDTLAIIKKLSRDDNARNQLVNMAVNFTEKNGATIESINKQKPAADSVAVSVEEMNKKIDSLQATQKMLQAEIRKTQTLLSSDWNVPDSIQYQSKTFTASDSDHVVVSAIVCAKQEVFFEMPKSLDKSLLIKSIKAVEKNGYLKVNTVKYKFGYVFTWNNFWGYLLTVLALSLGSPFWFDLLNKLVKLRTSKAIVAEQDEKSRTSGLALSNRGILNRVG